jgi:hypothetical protein
VVFCLLVVTKRKGKKQRIRGVVDALGPSGSQPGSKGPWRLSFTLEAWRDGKGELHTTKLEVEQTASERAVDELMERIPTNAIFVFDVTITGPSNAKLLAVLGPPKRKDAELEAILRALTKPKKLKAAPFGTFTFDRALGWYSARVKWGGKMIRLYLSPENEDELERLLEVARKLFKGQERWTRRVQTFAVKELLELKNDYWLDEDEPKVSAKQFKQRMKLESISVDDDGEFTFTHADGDLFWGHAIAVGGNLKDGPNDADIPG